MNLPPEDNLRKEHKSSVPKVLFIQKFHCMPIMVSMCGFIHSLRRVERHDVTKIL